MLNHPALTICQDFWKHVYRVPNGEQIAAALNLHFDGVQSGYGSIPSKMQFTDNVTGSTTYGNSFEEVKENIEKMREEFKNVCSI